MDSMKLNDWLTLLAISLGPLLGIAITKWFEVRKQNRDSKMALFLALIANRKSYPAPSTQFMDAVNQIDVVFYDVPLVVQAWREFYDCVNKPKEQINRQSANHCLLDLLHEMASHLGYPKMKQTQIDRFYIPDVYGSVIDLRSATEYEWLRVLQNTSHMLLAPNTAQPAQQEQPQSNMPQISSTQVIPPESS